MTTPHPTPGKALESVKLLRKGDLLRIVCDDCWGGIEPKKGQVVSVADHDGEKFIGLVGLQQGNVGWKASRFSFIGRPDADGWIAWTGGENPVPEIAVDVMTRSGHVIKDVGPSQPNGDVSWSHPAEGASNDTADIISFRIARPTPEVEGESLNDLLRRAVDTMKSWTPEQREAHFEAQKKAWVAAEMAWGDEGTRVIQTPMHRDPAKATEALGIRTDTPPPAAPDDAGLEVVAWRYQQARSYDTWRFSPRDQSAVPGIYDSEPLVTLASAQAALEAERALREIEAAAGMQAEAGRLAAKARAERLEGAGTKMFRAGIAYAAEEMDALADPGSDHGKARQKAADTYADASEWLRGLSPDEVTEAAAKALASQPQAGVGE